MTWRRTEAAIPNTRECGWHGLKWEAAWSCSRKKRVSRFGQGCLGGSNARLQVADEDAHCRLYCREQRVVTVSQHHARKQLQADGERSGFVPFERSRRPNAMDDGEHIVVVRYFEAECILVVASVVSPRQCLDTYAIAMCLHHDARVDAAR